MSEAEKGWKKEEAESMKKFERDFQQVHVASFKWMVNKEHDEVGRSMKTNERDETWD